VGHPGRDRLHAHHALAVQVAADQRHAALLARVRPRRGVALQETAAAAAHRARGCGQNQVLLAGRHHLGRHPRHEQEHDDLTAHLHVREVPQVGRHTRTRGCALHTYQVQIHQVTRHADKRAI